MDVAQTKVIPEGWAITAQPSGMTLVQTIWLSSYPEKCHLIAVNAF